MTWKKYLNPEVGTSESLPFLIVWGLLIFAVYKISGIGEADAV